MNVPFNDFKSEYAELKPSLDTAVHRVLESGWYLLGDELKTFEGKLKDALEIEFALGVANGTDAIALALMALDIGPGDEVITTALTAYPTITGIQMAGAKPVVVDVDLATGLIDPTAIEAAVTPRTRCIIPVHLYGQCADMTAILAIAKRRGLRVVEDCAQAILARHDGAIAGGMGDIGCYSFYPTKNLGAFGDAGAVATRDPDLARRLEAMRNYGQTAKYRHDLPGRNSRLDELQAAILAVKLDHLAAWTTRRQTLAQRYRDELQGVDSLSVLPTSEHVYHLYVVRHPERDRLITHLAAAGIQALIHYPLAIHQQRAYNGAAGPLPHAELLAREVLSLPLRPTLTNDDQTLIIDTVNRHVNS